ncbi:hypothetical protein SAMN05880582_1011539 [Rhizobium sp. RU20A]|uniref:hypothetical protein n=1 Tax=Rhizobium sp. RU20A TaxID=1907412 RepID=UPI00095439C7|nr:hypothetical protein [Rhizobium sp. RU20A]SIQ34304.1 hypothetical protein SAMN05880582_1011539 [Rhizobium sp. RU20A]
MQTQYVILDPLGPLAADPTALEGQLMEFGMDREAFSISRRKDGRTRLEFWEPDGSEAERLLSRLGGLPA